MKTIHTDVAPAAIGPYSQAIQINGLLFTSGQIPLDPATMQIVGDSIESQTTQALANLDAILKAGGSAREAVIKTTVFLKSMNDFARMNEIYSKFFGNHKPARSCVEVARLPKDVLFEIECIASRTVDVD
jgi:2-iminobutanoate/2-iminopropanoate deaminase